MYNRLWLLIFILMLFPAAGCNPLGKGNLPGISVEVPIYPNAEVGESSKSVVAGVPSGTEFQVRSVFIRTGDSPEAILEFYKGSLDSVRVTDYGGYYAAWYRPEGFEEGERIEIQIPKNYKEPGYDVRQFKYKKGFLS